MLFASGSDPVAAVGTRGPGKGNLRGRDFGRVCGQPAVGRPVPREVNGTAFPLEGLCGAFPSEVEFLRPPTAPPTCLSPWGAVVDV